MSENPERKVDKIFSFIYDTLLDHLDKIIIVALIISIGFSIFKTFFIHGFNVDSYQYFALSIEKWIRTGETDYLFYNFYATERLLYPVIIAVLHIVIPMDISILAASLNLFFALMSIVVFRKLLEIYDFENTQINLCTLAWVLSYNFINYWFEIITDYTAFFFFLLFLFELKRVSLTGKKHKIVTSSFFLLLTILARAEYAIGIFLYFWLIKERKIRYLLLTLSIIFGLLFITLGGYISLFYDFVPFMYRDTLDSGNFILLFTLLNTKWTSITYVGDFLKGILKVGILPSIIGIFVITKNKRKTFLGAFNKFSFLLIWFLIFGSFYTFFYANIFSASGLRYWIPVSMIPVAFFTKQIHNKENKTLKSILLIFLVSFPLLWSAGEVYGNRNTPSGTGPVFQQSIYYNEMTDTVSVSQADEEYIRISLYNSSFFNSTALPEAYVLSEYGHHRAHFSFKLWLNSTQQISIKIRARSPNNAFWGISVFEAKRSFAPGVGDRIYNSQYNNVSDQFQTFNLTIDGAYLLRRVTLSVGGGPRSQIIWDYIQISVV